MKKNTVVSVLCLLFVVYHGAGNAEIKETQDVLGKIGAFRKTLSGREASDIRKGNIINKKVLAGRIVEFGKMNGDAIRKYQERIFGGMKKKDMPSEEIYTRICIADAAGNDELEKMITLYSILNPDPTSLGLFYAGTLLPPVLHNRQMDMEEITGWLAFFSFASPEWSMSEKKDDIVVVNAYYGEKDVLTFKFTSNEMVWVPAMMYWWQKK